MPRDIHGYYTLEAVDVNDRDKVSELVSMNVRTK